MSAAPVPSLRMTIHVWLLRTPSHDRLVAAERDSAGEYSAIFTSSEAGNYSVTDVTEAVREFITLNPEWVRDCLAELPHEGAQ